MRIDDCPLATKEVMAVVVTHNGAAWIQGCLHSLADSYHPVTAIVVDNGSTDDTLALVGAFPDVICLPQNANLGFGRANNIGIRLALERKARWVFMLNQDARVKPGTVGELVRVSLLHPRFGILSPFHLDGEGANLDARFATYLHRAGAGLLSDLYRSRVQEVYSTTFVNAAAWLVTSDCLHTVGGFNPLFFMYGEDDNYCNRARSHGFEIGLVPSAIIFHDRPRERFSGGGQETGVKRLVAWKFSRMLRDLSQPHGSFVRRLGSWVLVSLRAGLTLAVTGQLGELLAWVIAFLRIFVILPGVYMHRKIAREQGRHWL